MLVVTLSRATRSYHVLVNHRIHTLTYQSGREGPHWRIPVNDYPAAIYERPSDPQVGDM